MSGRRIIECTPNTLREMVVERDYWKSRTLAAERYINAYVNKEHLAIIEKYYNDWQDDKNSEPGIDGIKK